MAFGPHGPRAPTSAPGEGFKVLFATAGLVGLAGVLFYAVQLFGKSLFKNFFFFFFFFHFAHPTFFLFFVFVV